VRGLINDQGLTGLQGQGDARARCVMVGDQAQELRHIGVVCLQVVAGHGQSHTQHLGGQRGLTRRHLPREQATRARRGVCQGARL